MFFYSKQGRLVYFDETKYYNKENFYNDFFYLKYGIKIMTNDTLNDIIEYLN